MPVLLEAYSVLIRHKAAAAKYSGGWAQFARDVPNNTFCADGEIIRVGFMNPTDFSVYIELLKQRGLMHLDGDGHAVDVAVVDAGSGPRQPCDWLEFGDAAVKKVPTAGVESNEGSIIWARLKGSQSLAVSLPKNWQGPQQLRLVDPQAVNKNLRFLRSDGNVDVFEDLETGKEVYVGRTGPRP
jgi:hypothetical protein